MQGYEDLRLELAELSKTRTAKTDRSIPTRKSLGLRNTRTNASQMANDAAESVEEAGPQGDEKPDENDEDDFELGTFLKDGHFEKRASGRSAKKVGVVYKNLTVQGVGATSTFVKTLPSAIVGVSGCLPPDWSHT
jgi:hypothetical protein